eukprot:3752564-Rhodomonas_salina.3
MESSSILVYTLLRAYACGLGDRAIPLPVCSCKARYAPTRMIPPNAYAYDNSYKLLTHAYGATRALSGEEIVHSLTT